MGESPGSSSLGTAGQAPAPKNLDSKLTCTLFLPQVCGERPKSKETISREGWLRAASGRVGHRRVATPLGQTPRPWLVAEP